jgi:cellulose synthase/poly-beta-1,6-N-acetylglucosamine synthase-like glycosyltransferase
MSHKPLISIIIPCKEIDAYTKESIIGCKNLDYPNYEIIVLPDQSSENIDGVRVLPTGPISPGAKRNIGVREANGVYCAFIDNDAYPRQDWLKNALKYLENSQIGGVGGPGLTPQTDNELQKAGGYVLSSFMVGNLSNRYKTKSSFESDDIHSCNFIAPKSVIIEAGGWNEKYWPGEDTLMCLAIKKIGKKLIESSDVIVYHHRRSLFRPHLKQHSRFGEHRGFFAKKFPQNSVKPTYFLPSALVLSLVILTVISIIYRPFTYLELVGICAYLLSSLAAAFSQVRSARLIFLIWLGIIATHLVYGLYFLSGLVKRDLKR